MKKDWYSTEQKQKLEKWLDLKYGMFIHFGLFSITAGCWKGEQIKIGYCEQILSHGNVPQVDYENLKNEFTIEKFNANDIVSLAKKAGMKYIVITSKHHDGFCLFNTNTTSYNSVQSACGRDIVAELSQACKEEGILFGIYFSLIDWHCPWALPISSHNSDKIPQKHHEYNLAQLTELLSNYGDVCELWLDMGFPSPEQSSDIRNLVHSLQKNTMINGRIWNDCGDFETMPDNEIPELNAPEYELNVPWQTPASIYRETWCYKSWLKRGDESEKIAELTNTLRKVVYNGGNYLLNIGPMGDGSILPFEENILLGIAKNLKQEGLSRKRMAESMPTIKAREDGTLLLSNAIKLYRHTAKEYYNLHPIVTGLKWYIDAPSDKEYTLCWKCDKPLKEDIKLCFEDNDQRLYFTLRKGKISAIITEHYRLPKAVAEKKILEVSTIGCPLTRQEFPLDGFSLTLV